MISQTVTAGRVAKKTSNVRLMLVADDLEQTEQILVRALAPYRARFAPLVRHLRHFRGKRLRPALLLLAARACGRVTPAHHVLAAVVEMIHTATLVHDDVLDEAQTRRHVGTINAGWGNKLSILLGDLLFTSAFHLSSTIGDARACEWIGEATNRVCAGELAQSAERGNLHLGEDEYLAMVEGKTAALTECCCRLGAFFAAADGTLVNDMARYGRHLGIAFQIADDVLDLTGDEMAAGKTLGTDLSQQKLTLPLIYLLERVDADEAERLRGGLRTGHIDLDRLNDMLRTTGALEAAGRRAEAFADRACEALAGLPSTPFRTALEGLAHWSVRRQP